MLTNLFVNIVQQVSRDSIPFAVDPTSDCDRSVIKIFKNDKRVEAIVFQFHFTMYRASIDFSFKLSGKLVIFLPIVHTHDVYNNFFGNPEHHVS